MLYRATTHIDFLKDFIQLAQIGGGELQTLERGDLCVCARARAHACVCARACMRVCVCVCVCGCVGVCRLSRPAAYG